MLSQAKIEETARKHNVSAAAVEALAKAISLGGGSLAQFSHPDLGGSGQWMKGGMLMIGDMFNDRLKSRVAALCLDVADALGESPSNSEHASRSSVGWWPADFGIPSSVGSQNEMRYAFFPTTRRLIIDDNGKVSVFDTGEHVITGVGQQQSGQQSLSFTTAHGPIDLTSLRRVE
jgi:hypothetical protein